MKKFISIFLMLLLVYSVSNVQAVSIETFEELKDAISNSESEIDIESDLYFDDVLIISGDITINGNGHAITRDTLYLQELFSIPLYGIVSSVVS